MSSSSSSGASAAAAFTPVSQQQQQQQMPAENLSSVMQLPAPVQEETPSDAEQLCYVHCHICDTVLVVSVPSSSLFKTVTVRCGHCSSLLTVDMRGLLMPTTATATPTTTAAMSANSAVTTSTRTSPPPAAAADHRQFHYPNSLTILPPRHSLLDEISSPNPSLQLLEQHGLGALIAAAGGRNAAAPVPLPPPASVGKGPGKEPSPRTNTVVNRPPEKRQRVPSAYNRFIKDEIQRIKAGNPDISHREAFSAAAKNWAHFPHIHFGLMPDHQGLRKTSLLPQDHQRKDGHGHLKDGLYAAANMGVAPY
nr:protein YABBY 3-like [Lolium perenne]